ncbi:membrane-spanning 4-domains subfamily A member 7-like isoform X1 [Bos javanicus]|uniref:membrane-spanning 4-domains subfamily A member 7-like isoform X1 n=1 Tax=Bos javanicus TaxID=9906 RepID=UPI002AA5ED09|nr:membrane-spanning 4-domains subfamily A member 7-like isoform X1 [Bos javanicus]
MPSPLKLMTNRALDAFTPKGVVISKREKPGHVYQKDDLPKGLPKEATVLGIIQILCFLVISSLGVILVSAPNSSQLSPAISSILMTGYPFLGALCFAITGTVSIISGKKSNKPFAINSLIFSAVSSVAAGVGLILLAGSLVALRTASQQCDSGRDYLSSLPYSTYYYSIYDVKDCLLTIVDLTGVLLVMLNFTVLELLAAAYASVFWWKRSTVTALHSSSHE